MSNPRDFSDADVVSHARESLVDFIVEDDLKDNPPLPGVHNRTQAMAQKGEGADKADQILLYLGGHANGSVRLDDILLPFSDGSLDSVEEVLGTVKQLAAEGRVAISSGRVVLQ